MRDSNMWWPMEYSHVVNDAVLKFFVGRIQLVLESFEPFKDPVDASLARGHHSNAIRWRVALFATADDATVLR